MSQNAEFYKTLLDNLYDGVYFVDTERNITYWNSGAEAITGYKANQVTGRSCKDNILNHCTENGTELCLTACPLVRSIQTGRHQEAEVYLHHADGHRVPVLVRTSPIYGEDGQVIGAVEIFSDNSRLFSARKRIRRLEETVALDALTGIGNRRMADGKLKAAITQFQQNRLSFGVLLLDIDLFKRVNDTFGHDIGDQVLRMVANTLRHNLRVNDIPIRWGGEEFLAVIDDVDKESLLAAAEKIRTLIEHSHLTLEDGRTVGVTVSIGAALVRYEDSLESLLLRADSLMYACKQAGRNCVRCE